VDLTGDGVSELVIEQLFNLVVIGCNHGGYTTLLDFNPTHDGAPSIVAAQDMNLNGIADLVLTYDVTSGSNAVIDILEWDGSQFKSLIQANHGQNSVATSRLAKALYWYSQGSQPWFEDPEVNVPTMNGGAQITIRDLDNDGTKELIVTDKGPLHPDTIYNFGPWRGQQVVFKWDGLHYLYAALALEPPLYRFQAVQDADRFFFMKEYDQALAIYQEVVFSDKLDWWSQDKFMFLRNSYYAQMTKDVPPPTPVPDLNEYSNLAAYARYRILLYHLVQGQSDEASVVYKILLEKFPTGSAGQPYAEMAALLWNEYTRTQSLESACLPVVAYVESHPETMDALGNNAFIRANYVSHGFQSHLYAPEDICPFK